MTSAKPDYHNKPLLGVRVDAELRDWGKAEAERRDQSFGDFVAGLFVDERERVANHVVDPIFVAAEDEQPEPARRNCKHRNMKLGKGVCPDCKDWVGPAARASGGNQ